jgi:hypothetical protein
VVELHSLATAKNGMRFDNRCSWAVYFHHGVIVRVLGYLDSVIVARLFEENPSMPESNGMDAPTLKRHQRAKVEVLAAT